MIIFITIKIGHPSKKINRSELSSLFDFFSSVDISNFSLSTFSIKPKWADRNYRRLITKPLGLFCNPPPPNTPKWQLLKTDVDLLYHREHSVAVSAVVYTPSEVNKFFAISLPLVYLYTRMKKKGRKIMSG